MKALVAVAEYYKFDGWLVNCETELGSSQSASRVADFTAKLTQLMHERIPHSEVMWYDSLTAQGKLKWQSVLNDKNDMFFQVCDGMFTDYHWHQGAPEESKAQAGIRGCDVYHGIDVFGRGTYGGGRFSGTALALQDIAKAEISAALFAPGWTYESAGGKQVNVNCYDNLRECERRVFGEILHLILETSLNTQPTL